MFEYQSNILNNYASVTYSLSLYAVSKDNYNKVVDGVVNLDSVHLVDLGKKVVFAETGGASMSINNVVISSSPNNTEQNILNNCSFDLIQPFGMGLAEKFVLAGEMLGWKSYMSSLNLFLEIRFSGIKSDGVQDLNVMTITLPVQVKTINTNMSPTGTIYNVHTAILGSTHRQDTYAFITEQTTIDDIKTTNDFFDKLEKKINNPTNPDLSHDQTNIDTISFEIDKRLQNLTFKTPDENTPIQDVQLNYDENTGATVHIPHNTSIPKLIENTLSVIPEVQALLLDTDYIGVSIYCEPIVTYKDYDATLGRDIRNVKWIVSLREVNKVVSSHVSKSVILHDLKAKGQITKHYEHYYTGLNTEVLDANIDFNTYTFNKITKYDNLFSNYANTEGFAAIKVEDKKNVLNQTNLTAKARNKVFGSKPTNADRDDGKVYIDNVTTISSEIIEKYSGNKFVKAVNDKGSSTSQTNNSRKDAYLLELENIRRSTSTSMLKLDLEIKGDPYWLLPFNSAVKYSNQSNSMVRGILFETGYPRDVTDKNALHKDQYFSGLYIVKSITSNFNSGKFTQKLECVRIPNISFESL